MRSFVQSLAAAALVTADFELCSATMNRGAFAVGVSPSPTAIPVSGNILDASVFSVQVGEINVYLAADDGASFRLLDTFPVAASDLTPISGLRVASRYVRVTFTNLGAIASNVEVFVSIRSS